MNNSEQIKDVSTKFEALRNNIDELKSEIEELKYFNRVLSINYGQYLIFKVKSKNCIFYKLQKKHRLTN